ncbi:MAG: hypothetical protein WD065_13620 [Planctomycetaceae bacterium]
MFKLWVTGITILALLGHSLWGCCEHHHDACAHAHFRADHDALMSDCHEDHAASEDDSHNGHGIHDDGDAPADRDCPAGDESHHPTKGCELVRCVYIGSDARIDCDFPVATMETASSDDEGLVFSAGSTTSSRFFERALSPPAQRRHALLQCWLI